MDNLMEITLDTGAESIPVKDQATGDQIGAIRFNPADLNIVSRYESVIDYFNSMDFKQDMDTDQSFEAITRLGNAIEERIDFLLGYKVSGVLFSICNPLTPLKNGDFYFEGVLESIGNLIESSMNQRMEKKLNKVRAATAGRKK